MAASPPFRLMRAAVFAAVCTGVSALSHGLAAETPVPLPGLIVGALLMGAVGWALTGAERQYGAIAGWLAWGQVAQHITFSLAGDVPGHAHSAAPLPPPQTDSGGMLMAHLAAVLVCAWWLRWGESCAFAVVAALRGLAPVWLLGPVVVPAAPAGLPLPRASRVPTPLRRALRVRCPRGPPRPV